MAHTKCKVNRKIVDGMQLESSGGHPLLVSAPVQQGITGSLSNQQPPPSKIIPFSKACSSCFPVIFVWWQCWHGLDYAWLSRIKCNFECCTLIGWYALYEFLIRYHLSYIKITTINSSYVICTHGSRRHQVERVWELECWMIWIITRQQRDEKVEEKRAGGWLR